MRLQTIRKDLFTVTLLTLFSSALLAQHHLPVVSSDTIFAGEVSEVLMINPGLSQGGYLEIFLIPGEDFPRDECSDCNEDTIHAEQVELVNDTLIAAVFDIPMGTYPGMYRLNLWGETGSAQNPIFWILSEPYIYESPGDETVCFGSEVIFEVKAYQPDEIMFYQWYYNGVLKEGEEGAILDLGPVEMADAGLYTCELNNEWGTTVDSVYLSLHPYQENGGAPTGPTHLCMGSDPTVYQVPVDPLIDTYLWNLVPEEAGTLVEDGSSVTVQWSADFAGEAQIYAETGLGACAGVTSEMMDIQLTGPTMVPEICIVGVDEASGKYRIVWNKLDDGSVTAYNIYRESNQAGEFLKIETVSSNDFSVYVDDSSAPDILSHSYRISYSDTCGNESEFSPFHSTVHLTASLGTGGENHLNWSSYQGFAFLSYEIHRGSSTESMELLQEVPSNVASFTDQDPPERAFYQIVVSRDGSCLPSKKGTATDYSVSRSNVYELNTSSVDQDMSGKGFELFPNPASQEVTVSIPEHGGNTVTLTIYDVTGQQVALYNISTTTTTLPVGMLKSGVYFIKVETAGVSTVEKLVVR